MAMAAQLPGPLNFFKALSKHMLKREKEKSIENLSVSTGPSPGPCCILQVPSLSYVPVP